MSTPQTLKEAAAMGVRILSRDGQLTVDGPKGTLTPELVGKLKQAKPDLLKVYGLCQTAAYGLSIEPDTLFASLDPSDVELMISGDFGPEGLRCYAESLAIGIRCGRVILNDRGQITNHFNLRN